MSSGPFQLVCALSGGVPVEPVVNPANGIIYEKSLIARHLSSSHEDPLTGQPLTMENLIKLAPRSLQAAVKPKMPGNSSMPAMLNTISSEFDQALLENFQLRQQILTLRRELSHALYQQEAGQRVIARLITEREEAREKLGNIEGFQPQAPPASSEPPDGPSDGPFSPQISAVFLSTAEALRRDRKKIVKALAEKAAPRDSLKSFDLLSSHPLHLPGGISCLAGHRNFPEILCTGGEDRKLAVFHLGNSRCVAPSFHHEAPVTAVEFHSRSLAFASADSQGKSAIFSENENSEYSIAHTFSPHSAAISALSIHASGDFLATASLDFSWCLSDFQTGKIVRRYRNDKTKFHCGKFHVDGLIYGAGTANSQVQIFDVREGAVVATLEGHAAGTEIRSIDFSANGVHIASADSTGTIKLWDLRKVKGTDKYEMKTIEVSREPVICLSFDFSSSYLAWAAGPSVGILETRDWSSVKQWEAHNGVCSGVSFGSDAKLLVTSGLSDSQLKVWQ